MNVALQSQGAVAGITGPPQEWGQCLPAAWRGSWLLAGRVPDPPWVDSGAESQRLDACVPMHGAGHSRVPQPLPKPLCCSTSAPGFPQVPKQQRAPRMRLRPSLQNRITPFALSASCVPVHYCIVCERVRVFLHRVCTCVHFSASCVHICTCISVSCVHTPVAVSHVACFLLDDCREAH